MIIGLKCLNLKPKSEVIVPANSYVASIIAIIRAGLTPILTEPLASTCNIDPDEIRKNITQNTTAIMPVHLYGQSCNMDEITKIAQEYNLKIVEDAAQSHGAKFKNKNTGSFGDIGCFSFYPTKNLGALGDGGAIITNNKDIAEKAKILRNYGFKEKYNCHQLGHNSRLDEVQAAFLRIKLKALDKINNKKRKLANIYFSQITNPDITLPKQDADYYDIHHIFNIRSEKRDALQKYLLDNNIQTNIHYPVAPHQQEGIKNLINNENNLKITEKIHQTTLSLPISYFHNENDVEKVTQMINDFQ